MFIKSLKYFLVALCNFVLLNVLLQLAFDKIVNAFSDAMMLELAKIIGVSLLVLVCMRVLVEILRNRQINQVKTRIKLSAALTILVSSFLYVSYFKSIYLNRIAHGEVRRSVIKKMFPPEKLPGYAFSADSLTFTEYNEVWKNGFLPGIPKEATNISALYWAEGFLPDYKIEVIYYLPPNIPVKEFKEEKSNFRLSQRVIEKGALQKVVYEENLY